MYKDIFFALSRAGADKRGPRRRRKGALRDARPARLLWLPLSLHNFVPGRDSGSRSDLSSCQDGEKQSVEMVREGGSHYL